jgi:CubicO group peptidase (beta-lactamase class C family)
MNLLSAAVASVVLSVLSGAASAAPDAAAQKNIDALFAEWSTTESPGAVLAVIKDGKVVRRGAWGMADIERQAANQASTNFHVASVSKQFTAFAIYLLAQDGKLGLDDDVRKYLPEMHDFGATITIRQLIHHTSGLRDQWNLLALAGWRLEDVITEDDVMRVVSAQRKLNFAPGKEHLYCNTGYTLLGIIVKRVSGKSLPAFTKERMFDPLGMKDTHFHDDYQSLVRGRASSYRKGENGDWKYVALSYSNVGATSLFTTVDDLAKWDQNFYDAKVGGKAVLEQMQTKGKLASGKEIDYAGGLVIGKYRGADIVEHGGGDAGFRTSIMRFPKQRLSVVLLSNAGNLSPGRMSRKVADAYLDASVEPLPLASAPKQHKEIALDPSRLDALVGDYALSPTVNISFTKENGKLMTQVTGQGKLPVFASGERTFFLKAVDAQFTFDAPGPDGVVAGGTLHQNGNHPVKRVTRAVPAKEELALREGLFYSEELNVIYKITQKDGKLVLHYPRGDIVLDQASATSFSAPFPVGTIDFRCDAARGCNSFSLTNGRVRKLVFSKVAITPLAPPEPEVSAFATMPVYLRGSMNAWGMSAPMQASGKVFATRLTLERGAHEFKIGSEDFSAIDFGGMADSAALAVGEARKLESVGTNLKLHVPEKASYLFSLDISDPDRPVLTVGAN